MVRCSWGRGAGLPDSALRIHLTLIRTEVRGQKKGLWGPEVSHDFFQEDSRSSFLSSDASWSVNKAPCPVSLGKFPNLSEPQFIPLLEINIYLSELLWELNDWACVCLGQCPAHRKCLVCATYLSLLMGGSLYPNLNPRGKNPVTWLLTQFVFLLSDFQGCISRGNLRINYYSPLMNCGFPLKTIFLHWPRMNHQEAFLHFRLSANSLQTANRLGLWEVILLWL